MIVLAVQDERAAGGVDVARADRSGYFDAMADLAAVSGYAVVVAFTTLPVLAVIAVLLDSGKASRGWAVTCGYALGLAVVFAAASFGLGQLPLPRLRVRGVTELAAGTLLLLLAAGLWLWRRHRAARRPRTEADHRRPRKAHPLSSPRATFVGVQFAFHPENLALTFAAASHITELTWPGRIATAVWFALVGVSTVAIPSFAFGVAGDRTRDRLAKLRTAIDTHSFVLTELLLAAVGALLVGLGLWRVLSL